MDKVFKGDPHQDLLVRLTGKAWQIWWKNKHEGRVISHEDAAVQALQGNQELALPSDATGRVSVQNIVDRMRATARESREKRRDAKEAEKVQHNFAFVTSASVCKKKPGPPVKQTVML